MGARMVATCVKTTIAFRRVVPGCTSAIPMKPVPTVIRFSVSRVETPNGPGDSSVPIAVKNGNGVEPGGPAYEP